MRKGSRALNAQILHCSGVTSPEKRIGEHITPQPNGCWLYGEDSSTYSRVRFAGSFLQAHRFVYETLRGPIPEGHHLHHLCGSPACCNPAHLRPLTPFDHVQAHKALRQAPKERPR